MGSCLSRNRGGRSGAETQDNAGGRHRSSRSQSRRRRRQCDRNGIPLSQRLDTPLKRLAWIHDEAKEGPPPTVTRLEREREDFWFTRVTGVPQVWNVIRAICEMLMDDDSNEQLDICRDMLTAAEITLPTGSFEGGAWDKTGNQYRVPRHVICNPLNVRPPSPKPTIETSSSNTMSGGEEENSRKVVSLESMHMMAKFRVQYNYDIRDIDVDFWSDEKMKKIAVRIIKQFGLDPETHRACFLLDGKPFNQKKTIMDRAQPLWLANRITQVFIRQANADDALRQHTPSPPIDPERLPVPFPPPPERFNTEAAQPEAGPSQTSDENQGPAPSKQDQTSNENQDPAPSKQNQISASKLPEETSTSKPPEETTDPTDPTPASKEV
ncbi:hypothetical protein TWF730_008226 [Orbilia blumenaviensis]|uniref:DC-UbP/UBTD2 N-terminal domain-containing protein n=1 Tax=Orbilia blumenaviensis TaxID=1796055 RepID=A0AAV9V407_9PEZI